jgi:DNA-binding helix-hairpin-helix protein with protein kinase domain
MTLAAHGISTAADVTRSHVATVPGFGDTLTAALLAWRQEVERRFRFDPTAAVSEGEQRAVAIRFRTRQQQLLGDIDQKLVALRSFGPGCKAELEALTGSLGEAVAAYEQADVNLALLRRST